MRGMIPPSRAGAEKMFKRKAHPDASLTPGAFIKKRVTDPLRAEARQGFNRAVKMFKRY